MPNSMDSLHRQYDLHEYLLPETFAVTQMTKILSVSIQRGAKHGSLSTYQVELRENQTVLDVVTEVQRRFEPSLAYRFACRVGVCGSCAMTVNGKPRWTCRTHVNEVIDGDSITIEPLRNLPVIKDLVCDFEPFFKSWQRAGGQFKPTRTRHDPPERLRPDHPARAAANEAIECINCAVCYSACDVVGWDHDYAGPAALNRVWTLVNDARHADQKVTINQAFADGGCGSCHSQGNCTRHCPVELSPSHSIAALKKSSLFGAPDLSDATVAESVEP